MGVMPLPAARKKICLNAFMLSGKVKKPAAPTACSMSPGFSLSVSIRENAPFCIRFTPIANDSFNTGDEMME